MSATSVIDTEKENPPTAKSSTWVATGTLVRRELVRFLRQRSRVVGALGQPIIFWILFGAGLQGSFKTPSWVPDGATLSYQEYFLPGIIALILLNTAIFSTVSIIEDRREGFLQGVLVSPAPRLAIVLGKLIGGTLLAVGQVLIFLALGPLIAWIGLAPAIPWLHSFPQALAVLCFLTTMALSMTALGYIVVWPMSSTQGFHAIMMIFLTPMWLLSGAFFPGDGSVWLSWIIRLNPMTYGVAGLRRLMSPHLDLAVTPTMPGMPLSVAVSIAFGLVCVGAAVVQTHSRNSRNVQ
ncbi:ABC transporter permease [Thalassoroseus pseudoceratinae]|uniref:ABC transporter permease n=1 Tax=Thalassoroseus pseudoceratinae TaxID=2713176 RepID=UPI00141E02B2|nr:ABC transporter permease [Thalassoroseus pseudoceratinae]